MKSVAVLGGKGGTTKTASSHLICLGAFLQFYMRAGLFTDGGKREREKLSKRTGGANGMPEPEAKPAHEATNDEDIL